MELDVGRYQRFHQTEVSSRGLLSQGACRVAKLLE
jgi:hypothetical protein